MHGLSNAHASSTAVSKLCVEPYSIPHRPAAAAAHPQELVYCLLTCKCVSLPYGNCRDVCLLVTHVHVSHMSASAWNFPRVAGKLELRVHHVSKYCATLCSAAK